MQNIPFRDDHLPHVPLMNQLLSRLRASTSALHRQLDGLVPALRPTSDPEAYAEYLKRFHAGVAACWPMLDWNRLRALCLPEADRREERYGSIADDLKTLGHETPELSASHGSDDATIAGALYVLEGSVHGGRFLLTQIETSGLEIPAGAIGFLRGFDEDNGRMWSAFVQWLGSLEIPPDLFGQAEAAAVRSFENFIHSFEHPQWTP